MKLSDKRKQAIYGAVHERMMQLRIALARMSELDGTKLGERIDDVVAQAMDDAAAEAVKAAEGKL